MELHEALEILDKQNKDLAGDAMGQQGMMRSAVVFMMAHLKQLEELNMTLSRLVEDINKANHDLVTTIARSVNRLS